MLLRYNKQPINASVELPGSKSISNRILILKEVLGLKTETKNLSDSKDTQTLVEAIAQIKAGKNRVIDVGEAGTNMRFLTALLCMKEGDWTITGSNRMKERPIKPLVDALRQLRAGISYLEKDGFPPLKISGTKLQGNQIEVEGGISSQFISALLLIAPALENGLEIKVKNKSVSWSYVLMTLDLLSQFGIKVSTVLDTIKITNLELRITNPITIGAGFSVESDWSSASYWFSIAAIAPNAEIILKGLQKGSSQGDSVLTEVYKSFGVSSEFKEPGLILTKNSNIIKYFEYDFTDCPDIAQTVAVTCFALKINCKLTGLSTLKNKETDRILALKTELEKLGANVQTTNDSIVILNKPETGASTSSATRNQEPETSPKICTYGDHRMAMSFAPLVFLYPEIEIENPAVVQKSYPGFWEDLKELGITDV